MRFQIYATRVENINGLMIQKGTFGKRHLIKLGEGILTISLPSEPGAHSTYHGYVAAPDHPEHSWYSVEQVDLRFDQTPSIRFDGHDEDFNTRAVTQSDEARDAEKIIERSLDEGFDFWKRVLRWVAFAPGIGFDEFETRYSATVGRGYKIYRASDNLLFHNHGGRATAGGSDGQVNHQAWAFAQDAFDANEYPPVYFDFLHEAHLRLRAGQRRMAVVNAAIAAETAIRAAFRSTLPDMHSPVAERILESAAAQSLLSRWPDITGLTKRDVKSEGISDVHALLDLRNEIMHEGLSDATKLEIIGELLPKVAHFILHADRFRQSNLNERNWISPAFGQHERLTGQPIPRLSFN